MPPLPQHHLHLLRLIASVRGLTGSAPTVRQLAAPFDAGMRMSIRHHLKSLSRLGYLRLVRDPGWHEASLHLLRKGMDAVGMAYMNLGTISAGMPTEPFGDTGGWQLRIEDLVPEIADGDFFLTVEGDSMIGAGLEHGQYLVMRPNVPPQEGDVCAVWVEGYGSTLKKVYREGDVVRLVPANPDYDQIIVPAERVRIQGVLIAALAIRNLRDT